MQLIAASSKTLKTAGAALAMVACLVAASASAQAAAGRVTQVYGRVTVATPVGDISRVEKGTEVEPGATVNTAAGSFTKIRFTDGGSIFLRPSTRFRVEGYEDTAGEKKEERSFFSLLKGGMRFVTGLIARRNRDAYRINTPTATIGIRGTDGALLLDQRGLHLKVFDGEVVLVTGTGREITTAAGGAAFASNAGEAEATDPDQSPISEDNFPDPEGDAPAADCAP